MYFFVLYSTKKCLATAFKLTQWWKIFWKFVLLNIIIFTLYVPFAVIWKYIDFKAKNVNLYLDYSYEIWDKKAQDVLSNQDFYAYKALSLEYWKIDDRILFISSRNYFILQVLYFILSFVFLYWIYQMLLASFYKRVLKKKKEK